MIEAVFNGVSNQRWLEVMKQDLDGFSVSSSCHESTKNRLNCWYRGGWCGKDSPQSEKPTKEDSGHFSEMESWTQSPQNLIQIRLWLQNATSGLSISHGKVRLTFKLRFELEPMSHPQRKHVCRALAAEREEFFMWTSNLILWNVEISTKFENWWLSLSTLRVESPRSAFRIKQHK